MNNQDVIKAFLRGEDAKTQLRNIQNGYYTYKGRTLWTDKTNGIFILNNYITKIAFICGNKLYLNAHKFSVTTSKIQNQLRYEALRTNYEIVEYDEVIG